MAYNSSHNHLNANGSDGRKSVNSRAHSESHGLRKGSGSRFFYPPAVQNKQNFSSNQHQQTSFFKPKDQFSRSRGEQQNQNAIQKSMSFFNPCADNSAQKGAANEGSSQWSEIVATLGSAHPMPISREAASTWFYPSNYPIREYQLSIVKKALFSNTLVVLPTGMGKTLIAAVVMFNFYRWFPTGKIVFMAPTKPLVNQQIKACHSVMGIPEKHTAELMGSVKSAKRKSLWQSHRVFYCTPQTLNNDIQKEICDPSKFVCVVIDEAHRASAMGYAYTPVAAAITAASIHVRILALSATPGKNIESVQQVIYNLRIRTIEVRGEEDPDLKKYSFDRLMEVIKCEKGAQLQELERMLLECMEPVTSYYNSQSLLRAREPSRITKYMLIQEMNSPRVNAMPPAQLFQVKADLGFLMSMVNARSTLSNLGVGAFKQNLLDIEHSTKRSRARLQVLQDSCWKNLKAVLGAISEDDNGKAIGSTHPKMIKLKEILSEHFHRHQANGRSTRAIVFSGTRNSVDEIVKELKTTPLVRPKAFVGQSCGKKLPDGSKQLQGQNQKQQKQTIQDFHQGKFNVLVATSIGEEGLDIGEVDIIISFDTVGSPIRMVQRFGRTGRKRVGKVCILVTEGSEEQKLQKAATGSKSINNALKRHKFDTFPNDQRMIPADIEPRMIEKIMKVDLYHFSQVAGYKTRKKAPSTNTSWKLTAEQQEKLAAMYSPSDGDFVYKPNYKLGWKRLKDPQFTDLIQHSSKTNILINLKDFVRNKKWEVLYDQHKMECSRMLFDLDGSDSGEIDTNPKKTSRKKKGPIAEWVKKMVGMKHSLEKKHSKTKSFTGGSKADNYWKCTCGVRCIKSSTQCVMCGSIKPHQSKSIFVDEDDEEGNETVDDEATESDDATESEDNQETFGNKEDLPGGEKGDTTLMTNSEKDPPLINLVQTNSPINMLDDSTRVSNPHKICECKLGGNGQEVKCSFCIQEQRAEKDHESARTGDEETDQHNANQDVSQGDTYCIETPFQEEIEAEGDLELPSLHKLRQLSISDVLNDGSEKSAALINFYKVLGSPKKVDKENINPNFTLPVEKEELVLASPSSVTCNVQRNIFNLQTNSKESKIISYTQLCEGVDFDDYIPSQSVPINSTHTKGSIDSIQKSNIPDLKGTEQSDTSVVSTQILNRSLKDRVHFRLQDQKLNLDLATENIDRCQRIEKESVNELRLQPTDNSCTPPSRDLTHSSQDKPVPIQSNQMPEISPKAQNTSNGSLLKSDHEEREADKPTWNLWNGQDLIISDDDTDRDTDGTDDNSAICTTKKTEYNTPNKESQIISVEEIASNKKVSFSNLEQMSSQSLNQETCFLFDPSCRSSVNRAPIQTQIIEDIIENSVCDICGGGKSNESNLLVSCNGLLCDSSVHQNCYNIQTLSKDEDWLCDICRETEHSFRRKHKCELCQREGGTMKRSTCGKWVHLVCVLWTPELKVDGRKVPINLCALEKDRNNLKCALCNRKGGACIKCSCKSCSLAVHPFCVRSTESPGYFLAQKEEGIHKDFVVYCLAHKNDSGKLLVSTEPDDGVKNTVIDLCGTPGTTTNGKPKSSNKAADKPGWQLNLDDDEDEGSSEEIIVSAPKLAKEAAFQSPGASGSSQVGLTQLMEGKDSSGSRRKKSRSRLRQIKDHNRKLQQKKRKRKNVNRKKEKQAAPKLTRRVSHEMVGKYFIDAEAEVTGSDNSTSDTDEFEEDELDAKFINDELSQGVSNTPGMYQRLDNQFQQEISPILMRGGRSLPFIQNCLQYVRDGGDAMDIEKAYYEEDSQESSADFMSPKAVKKGNLYIDLGDQEEDELEAVVQKKEKEECNSSSVTDKQRALIEEKRQAALKKLAQKRKQNQQSSCSNADNDPLGQHTIDSKKNTAVECSIGNKTVRSVDDKPSLIRKNFSLELTHTQCVESSDSDMTDDEFQNKASSTTKMSVLEAQPFKSAERENWLSSPEAKKMCLKRNFNEVHPTSNPESSAISPTISPEIINCNGPNILQFQRNTSTHTNRALDTMDQTLNTSNIDDKKLNLNTNINNATSPPPIGTLNAKKSSDIMRHENKRGKPSFSLQLNSCNFDTSSDSDITDDEKKDGLNKVNIRNSMTCGGETKYHQSKSFGASLKGKTPLNPASASNFNLDISFDDSSSSSEDESLRQVCDKTSAQVATASGARPSQNPGILYSKQPPGVATSANTHKQELKRRNTSPIMSSLQSKGPRPLQRNHSHPTKVSHPPANVQKDQQHLHSLGKKEDIQSHVQKQNSNNAIRPLNISINESAVQTRAFQTPITKVSKNVIVSDRHSKQARITTLLRDQHGVSVSWTKLPENTDFQLNESTAAVLFIRSVLLKKPLQAFKQNITKLQKHYQQIHVFIIEDRQSFSESEYCRLKAMAAQTLSGVHLQIVQSISLLATALARIIQGFQK